MRWSAWCHCVRSAAADALAAVGLDVEARRVADADPWSLAVTLADVWAMCWPAGHPEPTRERLDARGAVYWAGTAIVAASMGAQREAAAAQRLMATYRRRLTTLAATGTKRKVRRAP